MEQAYRVGVASKAMSPKWMEIFFSLAPRPSEKHAMHDGNCSRVHSERTTNGGVNSTKAPSGGWN